MARSSIVYAKDLKVGDVLPASRQHGMMSIKGIIQAINPVTRLLEVTIRGPLGIIDKMDAYTRLSVYRDSKDE